MSREPIRIRFSFNNLRCHKLCYGILVDVSIGYLPDTGKLLTRYAPFRRSPPRIAPCAAPRLACVKPAASVHPEPGSNSSLYIFLFLLACSWRSNFFKKLTLSIKFFLNSLGTCLYLSFQYFQRTFSLSAKGIAKVDIYFDSANFFEKIFTFFWFYFSAGLNTDRPKNT